MAKTGRTVRNYNRIYGGAAAWGLDISADTQSIGEVGVDFDFSEQAAYSWGIKGGLLGAGIQTFGPVNQFVNAGTGLAHATMAAAQKTIVTMLLAMGVQEAPTYGTECIGGSWLMKSYRATGDEGLVTVTADFANPGAACNYPRFFGKMLHPLVAATGANTGTTNVVNNGAASTAGGYLVWVLTSINAGTATISVDDSADGSSYAAVTGLTTAALSGASAGIIQLATTATIRQYTRWQIALAGGANTATFALALIRG